MPLIRYTEVSGNRYGQVGSGGPYHSFPKTVRRLPVLRKNVSGRMWLCTIRLVATVTPEGQCLYRVVSSGYRPPYRWVACIHAKTRHNRITVDGRVGCWYLVCASELLSVVAPPASIIARGYLYVYRNRVEAKPLPCPFLNVRRSLFSRCNRPTLASTPGVAATGQNVRKTRRYCLPVGAIGQSHFRPNPC